MTTCNVETGQETAARTQMARNEAVEGAWPPLRVELVDGALVEMKEHAALQVLLRYKELEGFKQWLREMIQSMKCPTCGHRDLEEKDPVLVSLLTLTAVHRLEMPVFVCLRRVSTKCPAIAEILVQLLDFDLHFLGDPLLSAGVWLFRRRGATFSVKPEAFNCFPATPERVRLHVVFLEMTPCFCTPAPLIGFPSPFITGVQPLQPAG